MVHLLKLFVLLMASSCAVSASAEHTYSRKAHAGVAQPKFHTHGGLLNADDDVIAVAEEVVMRMLTGKDDKKAKREAAKKLKKATTRCKKTKKCAASRNTKGECGKECMKCAERCAKVAMKRMARHSRGSASVRVATPGGYYTAFPDSPGYYKMMVPGAPSGTP